MSPININSLSAVTAEAPQTIFVVEKTFGINRLTAHGRVIIQAGSLSLTSSTTGGDMIEISGTASLFNVDVDALVLGSGNFTVRSRTKDDISNWY